ncbi:hypothetical protein SEVIR_3G218500v4 [Setaria viridis]|uniref:Uncharacterized protein n=1 Tax=Setaria viridis TaxID=4556 RepID=A0A4U6VBR4_SETVI|nr:hypothetical protein SEVIR_3G218500v2 [Setaria viridis]
MAAAVLVYHWALLAEIKMDADTYASASAGRWWKVGLVTAATRRKWTQRPADSRHFCPRDVPCLEGGPSTSSSFLAAQPILHGWSFGGHPNPSHLHLFLLSLQVRECAK